MGQNGRRAIRMLARDLDGLVAFAAQIPVHRPWCLLREPGSRGHAGTSSRGGTSRSPLSRENDLLNGKEDFLDKIKELHWQEPEGHL